MPKTGRLVKRESAAVRLPRRRSASEGLAQRLGGTADPGARTLPRGQSRILRNIAAYARRQLAVSGEFAPSRGSGLVQGISLLFAGPAGTGKTLAAEALGNALRLDLYRVDLSAVVGKYIGETEKNLDRIFAAAAGRNVILYFDEADALFGKRSEVKDSHDRYANIEVNHLLQRLEEFRGLAVVAINQKGKVDPAFLQRFQFVCSFRKPGTRRSMIGRRSD